MSRLAPFALGAVACAASVACSAKDAAPVLLHDAVWCDLQAIPCLLPGVESDAGAATPCQVVGNVAVPASAPGGDRTCFDETLRSAQDACNALCDPATNHLNAALYPTGCTASIDTDAAVHARLDPRGVLANGCTNASVENDSYLSTVGTNSLKLAGAAQVSYGSSTETVAMHAGLYNFTAPDTSCTPIESACPVQVNQFELSFDDFAVADLTAKGLTTAVDGAFVAWSGQLIAGPPADSFLFWTPPGIVFDVVGSIHAPGGESFGFPMVSESTTSAALNLNTGEISVEVSLADVDIDGKSFGINGLATTAAVVDRAPTVTAPATLSADALGGCSALVTLSASAASAVGLPVTLDYVVDTTFVGSGASVSTEVAVGTHPVTIVAIDSLGEQGSTTETLTVTGPAACP